MVVSSCSPSFHWERHQHLRPGWPSAWFYVSFEIRQLHPSLLPCLCVRKYWPLFDGCEASLLFFPAIAVSGSIVYMRATSSLVALVTRSKWPISLTPSGSSSYVSYRYTSSSWSVTACCTSVTCAVRFGHLPTLLFFTLRWTRTFFIFCPFLLSMRAYVFLVCVALIWVLPFFWLPLLSCRRKLHRGHDRV